MPVTVSAQQPTRSITEIAENLYWARNNNHYAVFLVTSDGVILADTINADFSQWLKGEIQSRFGVPVRYVLYSHSHWDHASGGSVFADTATFVGHANMLNNLAMPPADTQLSAAAAALDSDGDGSLQQSEATGDFAEAFANFDANGDGRLSGAEVRRGPVSDVRAPDVVYTDRMTIRLGDASAELIYTGRMAHTDDMSVVLFPDQRAVFVVDFLSLGRLPFQALPDGPLDPWLNAIRAVENFDVDVVAPGHGVMGDLSDVAAHRRYIEELRDLVAAGITRGASLSELQAEIMMTPYQDWISYASWRPLNIEGMYRILTQ
jgi:glyoxylase-like metal-dependent hydrolase (beta-lactamase superfamily II)